MLKTIIINPGDYISNMDKQELLDTLNHDLSNKFQQLPNLEVENMKLNMENKQLKIQMHSLTLPPRSNGVR